MSISAQQQSCYVPVRVLPYSMAVLLLLLLFLQLVPWGVPGPCAGSSEDVDDVRGEEGAVQQLAVQLYHRHLGREYEFLYKKRIHGNLEA